MPSMALAKPSVILRPIANWKKNACLGYSCWSYAAGPLSVIGITNVASKVRRERYAPP